MIWLPLAVMAAAIWAVGNWVDRSAVLDTSLRVTDCICSSGFIGFAVGIFLFPFVFIHEPLWTASIFALGAGFMNASATAFYFSALHTGEPAVVVLILETNPLVSAVLAAIVLDQMLSPLQILGILLVCVGVVLVLEFRTKKARRDGMSSWLLAGGAAVLLGASWVLTRLALDKGLSYGATFSISRIGAFIPALSYFLLGGVSSRWIREHKTAYKALRRLLPAEILNLASSIIMIVAINNGPVALVAAASSIQPLFVLTYQKLMPNMPPARVGVVRIAASVGLVSLGMFALVK